MTHYDVLGVATDASPTAIRAAYLTLARRHHPDYYVDAPPAVRADAEQRMRAVNEAWAVLSDGSRRTAYDRDRGLAPDPHAFRPIEPDEPGDVDPRLEPDVPYRRVPAREERQTHLAVLLAVCLFGVAVVSLGVGVFFDVPAVLYFGSALLIPSSLSFVAVLLLQLSRATRDEG